MAVDRVLMNKAGVNMIQVDKCTGSCGQDEQGFAEEEGEQSGSEVGGCEKNGQPPWHEIYYFWSGVNHSKELMGGVGKHIVAFINMFLYFNNFTQLPPEDLLPCIAYFHLLLLPF